MLNGANSKSQHLATISDIGREGSVKGVQIRVWWYELEPQKGVYDFSSIDAYLARLKAQPTTKRLVVRIMDRRFGGSSKTGIVPSYLLTQSTYNGGVIQTSQGYAARLWEAPVMDRLIALYRAIGARYDGDANFEGVSTEETTLSLKTPFPSSYTATKLEAQYERLAVAARAAMPHTNVFVYTNFIGSQSLMTELIQSFVPLRVAAGDSNVIPGEMTLGQRIWTGQTGADYRGNLAIGTSVEAAELGGSHGDFTPKQINDFAYGTLRSNYMFWVYNTWMGDSSQRWSTGILPFLRTNPPIRTACPTSYGLCKN
jgi:hypothetical protein